MWYRVVPYAERQFLSSLTTGPDTPANGSSDRYIVDLPRGVVAANLALLRHRPRRVGRMEAKRWALRRSTETTGIISSNDAKLSDNNSRGLKNCYGDDHEKNHVTMLTRANSRQLQRYGTAVPLLMLRASKINFAVVKINWKTVQSAEVYAPYPPTELFEHLKVHCGWIELVDDNTVYSNGNKA